jgi:hypothetical protein
MEKAENTTELCRRMFIALTRAMNSARAGEIQLGITLKIVYESDGRLSRGRKREMKFESEKQYVAEQDRR